MKLNSRGGVSIFELAAYAPALVIAFFVCKRHGSFGRSSGWVYTIILCLIRIIGSCCQLATYNDDSKGLLETTIILDSIGISPLLFATLGLLSRCIDSINTSRKTPFSAVHFRLIQLVIMIGLIMSIVGGTSSISSTGVYKVQTTSETGIALYCVAFVALVLLASYTVSRISYITSSDNRLAWAVIIAMPFILVRLAYSLLVVFHHSHDFNLVSGSVAFLAGMSVAEEIIVVYIYLFAGWITDPPIKGSQGPILNRPWKGNLNASASQGASTSGTRRGRATAGDMQGNKTADTRQDYGAASFQKRNPSPGVGQQYSSAGAGRSGGRGNGRGIRQGPIHGLIGLAVAAAQKNKGDVERG